MRRSRERRTVSFSALIRHEVRTRENLLSCTCHKEHRHARRVAIGKCDIIRVVPAFVRLNRNARSLLAAQRQRISRGGLTELFGWVAERQDALPCAVNLIGNSFLSGSLRMIHVVPAAPNRSGWATPRAIVVHSESSGTSFVLRHRDAG